MRTISAFILVFCMFCTVNARKPRDNFFKIRVAQWNIGQLSMGKKGKTVISSKSRKDRVMAFSRVINDVRADIFCFNEYAPYFSLKDSLMEDSTDLTRNVLLSMYEDCYYGERYGANCNCISIASGLINKFRTKDYQKMIQHRYYSIGEIEINGVEVIIIATHLEVPKYEKERKSQIQELLFLLRNEPYVILCADFNILNTSEYDIFKEEGFSMANHGALGDLITFPHNNGGYCLDNIMCKGFSVMGVNVYKTDLSDHYVISADLIMR